MNYLQGIMASALCIIGLPSGYAASVKETLRIGIYAPFSGKSAVIGRNILGAMEIAQDQFVSPQISYEFYSLDSSASRSNSDTVEKFIQAHHLNVLITENTLHGKQIAPLATQHHLVHFCLDGEAAIADGRQNFLIHHNSYQPGALLKDRTEFINRFKAEYFSVPLIEAGYAFDAFHVLHESVLLAMKGDAAFSNAGLGKHLLALKETQGLMGSVHVSNKGIIDVKEASLG